MQGFYSMKPSFAVIALIANIYSNSAFPCGVYNIAAKVVMVDGFSTFVINPKTKSEINLKVEFNESAKLTPYIERIITARVKIDEKMDFTRGKIAKIESLKEIPPDPLANDSGTYLKQINEEKCKK